MESKKIYIGMDPGKSGAIVIINGEKITSFKFPIIGSGKGSEYDIPAMNEIFREIATYKCHVVIEDVKALQKPMQAGNWSLSRGKTILEVLCHVHNIPHTLVHSKTWQKEMWQGIPKMTKGNKTDTKGMSELAAKRLFPTFDLRGEVEVKYYGDNANNRKLKRVGTEIPNKKVNADDGIVDGLLLAEYCKRKF